MQPKKKIYMTIGAYKRFKAERDQLNQIERPEIVKVVSWAAGNGDRSENADYQYGKKRLREIDRRVRFLNTRLNLALAVDPLEITSSNVQFSATVTIADVDDNQKTYTIVGVDEVDINKHHVSFKSPLGSAMMGKSEGEVFEFKTPKGETMEYEIISIQYIAVD